jgi:hypothetical protein
LKASDKSLLDSLTVNIYLYFVALNATLASMTVLLFQDILSVLAFFKYIFPQLPGSSGG